MTEKDPDSQDALAARFEAHRAHLGRVAYRMLGSRAEADDAVQETWLRLARADRDDVANLGAWLTTVVARVCLDLLRSRKARREEAALPDAFDPVVTREDPEDQVMLADSIGVALLVVLETLEPAERLAFVLHDMFAMSFDEIAPLVGRNEAAARQLASRARRRVQGAAPDAARGTDPPGREREVVNAFLEAARGGSLEGLLAVLDPDVIRRSDRGAIAPAVWDELRGAAEVAGQAMRYARLAASAEPVRVNGAPGSLSRHPDGTPFALMSFTIRAGKIVAIDIISDPAHLARLALP